MRYIFVICFIFFNILHGYSGTADSVCTLTGDIRGLGNHRLVLEYTYGRDAFCSDTIRAHKGHFVFTGRLPQPTSVHISALTNDHRSGDPKPLTYVSKRSHHRYPVWCTILLENRSMYIKCGLGSLNSTRVENAPLNDTVKAIRKIWSQLYMGDPAWRAWRKVHPHYWQVVLTANEKSERDSILNDIYRRQEDSTAAFIRSHPSSYAGASLIWFIHRSDSATRMALYNTIDSSLRGYPPVVGFKDNIHNKTIVNHLAIGSAAPEISLNDTSGRTIALSSFRGKVTLIDFWASWCGPCRAENPNVVDAYKKYHKKGLKIYAVSLDTDKDRWKAAIQKDNLSWTHVSDLKDWNSAAQTYGVHGIPDNFLLDKNGRVIAMNLRGKELRSVLRGILK